MARKRSTAKTCDRICHQQHSAGSTDLHARHASRIFLMRLPPMSDSAGYLCTIFSSSCLTCFSGTGSCTGFSSYCKRITAGHLTTGEPSAGNTVHDHRREGKAEDTGCSPANWRQYFQSGTPAWYQPAKSFSYQYTKKDAGSTADVLCFLFSVYFVSLLFLQIICFLH